jgi:hypothetical protein
MSSTKVFIKKHKSKKPGILLNPKDHLCINSGLESLNEEQIFSLKNNPIQISITEVLDNIPDKVRISIMNPIFTVKNAYIHKFDYDEEHLESDDSHENLPLIDNKINDIRKNLKETVLIRYPGQSFFIFPNKNFNKDTKLEFFVQLKVCNRNSAEILIYTNEGISVERSETYTPVDYNYELIPDVICNELGLIKQYRSPALEEETTKLDLNNKLEKLDPEDINFLRDERTLKFCIKQMNRVKFKEEEISTINELNFSDEYVSALVKSYLDKLAASDCNLYHIDKIEYFEGFSICDTRNAIYVIDPSSNSEAFRYSVDSPEDIKKAFIRRNSLYISGNYVPSEVGIKPLCIIKSDPNGDYKGLAWKEITSSYQLQVKSLKTGKPSTRIFNVKHMSKKMALISAIEFNFINTILYNKIGIEFNRMLMNLYQIRLWKEAITFIPSQKFEQEELQAIWTQAFGVIMVKGDNEDILLDYLSEEELNRLTIITTSI